MNVVGIIPARAGSRRIRHKNLAALDGRPLIAHTCEAALSAGVLSAVYVNTDCPTIAETALQCGVTCPILRPSDLAADHSPTRDANNFLLRFLLSRGEHYDAVMVLQPTSPLREAEDVRSAWSLFEENAPCAVVSVSPVAPSNWLGRIARDGGFEALTGDDAIHRLNGAIYVQTLDDYLLNRTPRRTLAYVMPASRGVDIDTPEDLTHAECLLRARHAPAGAA